MKQTIREIGTPTTDKEKIICITVDKLWTQITEIKPVSSTIIGSIIFSLIARLFDTIEEEEKQRYLKNLKKTCIDFINTLQKTI